MLLVVGRGTIRENKRLGYVRVFVCVLLVSWKEKSQHISLRTR